MLVFCCIRSGETNNKNYKKYASHFAKTKACQTVLQNKRLASGCINSVKPCVFHKDEDGLKVHANLQLFNRLTKRGETGVSIMKSNYY